jgi:hypothetical protein
MRPNGRKTKTTKKRPAQMQRQQKFTWQAQQSRRNASLDRKTPRTKAPIHQGKVNSRVFTKICMVTEDCTRAPDYSFFAACDGRHPSTFSSDAESEAIVSLSGIYTFRLYVPMHVHPHQTEEFWDSWTGRSSFDGYDLSVF